MAITYDKSRKRWRATVGTDRDGSRQRKWFHTRAEATVWEALQAVEKATPTTTPTQGAQKAPRGSQGLTDVPTTVGEILDHLWEHEWSIQRSRKSMWSGMKMIKPTLQDIDIRELTLADVESLVLTLRHRGSSGSTINRRLSLVSRALSWALNQGIIDRAFKVPRQREMEPRQSWLESDEVATLVRTLESWDRQEMADYVQLLSRTGMRPAECLALQVADVDMSRRMIRVMGTKTNRTRYVPVFPSAIDALQRRTEGKAKSSKLFTFTYRSFAHYWERLRHLMGWENDPEKVPYLLRHTFASLSIQGGMELSRVSRILGHANISMTMRYAKLAPEHLLSDTDPF